MRKNKTGVKRHTGGRDNRYQTLRRQYPVAAQLRRSKKIPRAAS